MRSLILLVALVPFALAQQKCQPDGRGVRMFNGKPCASTTRYNDGHRGSCGCGPPNSDTPFGWNLSGFMTAPSQKYFDNGGNREWCGGNCGKCVKLTPTGGYIPGEGGPSNNHSPLIFMVTNDCPFAGNEKWCKIYGTPGSGNVNSKGYEVHFDLQNHVSQISGRGWNNPEVTWEEVGCPGGYIPGEGGPTNNHSPLIFMVTNDCPFAGNEKWCKIYGTPGSGNVNSKGYEVHFDLQNHVGQISGRGWNNPEVTWEEVGCPGDLAGKWGSCECHWNGKK